MNMTSTIDSLPAADAANPIAERAERAPAPSTDALALRLAGGAQPDDADAGAGAGTANVERRAALSATGALATIDALLRDRDAVLARIRRGLGLAELGRCALLTVALACAIFGAAVGMHRGGVQILFAAIKFPLVMLFTAAIAAPCLTAFNAALDRPYAVRKDVALMLSALAFGALLLLAQAPLLLLAALLGLGYHAFILLTFCCAALAGIGCAAVLARGIASQSHRHAKIAVVALLAVLSAVGGQMAWTLRPYVVRPRTPEVPFLRQIEGNLLESVLTSSRSARGIYSEDYEAREYEIREFRGEEGGDYGDQFAPEFRAGDFMRDIDQMAEETVHPIEAIERSGDTAEPASDSAGYSRDEVGGRWSEIEDAQR